MAEGDAGIARVPPSGGYGGRKPPIEARKIFEGYFWGVAEMPCTGYKRPEGGGLEKAASLQGCGCVGWCFPLRGGNYNNAAAAGLGALNLNNLRANVNSNVGFRPALPLSQKSGLYGGLSSAEGKRSRVPSPRVSGENIDRHGRLVGVRLADRIPLMPLFYGPGA